MTDWLNTSYRLIDKPLRHHTEGLQQTASGYGSKLVSRFIAVLPDGRHRRIYVTLWSNAETAWIQLNGKRQILRDEMENS